MVVRSFNALSVDHLTLIKGDVVSVIENRPSGWSRVTNVDVGTGWFPTCYLEPLCCLPSRIDKEAEPQVGRPSLIVHEENIKEIGS